MSDFATPTFYLVLQRQRREAELTGLQADQSGQHLNAPRVIVRGYDRLQALWERGLIEQAELDRRKGLRHER